MSGLFPDDADDGRAQPVAPRPQRRRALLYTSIVLVVLFFAASAFTSIWTDRLWFVSVDHPEVFAKVITTRTVLFVLFGTLFGGDAGEEQRSEDLLHGEQHQERCCGVHEGVDRHQVVRVRLPPNLRLRCGSHRHQPPSRAGPTSIRV